MAEQLSGELLNPLPIRRLFHIDLHDEDCFIRGTFLLPNAPGERQPTGNKAGTWRKRVRCGPSAPLGG
jgi:hypothetical protein